MPGQFEVRAEGDALPSQALSPLPISLPNSPVSPIEQMLGRDLKLHVSSQTEPPSSWAIRRVVGMLDAKARFTTGMPEVFVRVGQNGDGADTAYFLDLGDRSGRAVAIRDQGWSVVDRPGVDFRRPGAFYSCPCRLDRSVAGSTTSCCAAICGSLCLPALTCNPRDAAANREKVLAGVSRRLSADLWAACSTRSSAACATAFSQS